MNNLFTTTTADPVVYVLDPAVSPNQDFALLLKAHRIDIVVDVRSYVPLECVADMRLPTLSSSLARLDIAYKYFLPLPGIEWLVESSRQWRIAVLCSQDHPDLCCHCSQMSQMLSVHGVVVRSLRAEERPQSPVEVFTIGVTRHSAPEFFGALKRAGVKRLLDVRLNNWTQLAGFTKRDDLPFFLKELCGIEYKHELLLAPTRELLNAYKKHGGDWRQYERDFRALMAERQVEKQILISLFEVPTVLLCYEAEADFCHRRLVLDYLQEKWGCLKITHL